MDPDFTKAIKTDFETWSGGFSPDSEEQIFVYVETARPSDSDEAAVLEILRTWMSEEESSSPSR